MSVIQTPEGAEGAAQKDWYAVSRPGERANTLRVPELAPGRGRRSFTRSRFRPAVMVIAGATTLVGSTLPWLATKLLGHTTTVLGTDHAIIHDLSVNGWTTFAGGAAVAVLAALMMVSDEMALRLLAALIAAATAAFAIYDTFRLYQRLDHTRSQAVHLGPAAVRLASHIHLGYGLFVTLAGAGVLFLASLLEAAAGAAD